MSQIRKLLESLDAISEGHGVMVDEKLTAIWKKHGEYTTMADEAENRENDTRLAKKYLNGAAKLEQQVAAQWGPEVSNAMLEHSDAMMESWFGYANRNKEGERKAKALRQQYEIDWDGSL